MCNNALKLFTSDLLTISLSGNPPLIEMMLLDKQKITPPEKMTRF